MTTALSPHDQARMKYARKPYLLAYKMELIAEVQAGRITRFNADCNLSGMSEHWSTQDIIDWADSRGLKPLWIANEPLQGPKFPPINKRLRYGGGTTVTPHHSWREYQGESCEHRWIVLQWSGYDCNDCLRHFGMLD